MAAKKLENMLEEELNTSYNLIKKVFGKKVLGPEFSKPSLYVGVEYEAKFKGTSSLSDLGRNPKMIYDDELNGIFVPRRMLEEGYPLSGEELKIERKYCFLHEIAHAFASQKNPELRGNNILKLINSESKSDNEKGLVYYAFHEGLANYIAIQCCLKSDKESLKRKGESKHKSLYDFFHGWVSSEEIKFTAKIYDMEYSPKDWQKLALRYFERNLNSLLSFKYMLGYIFASNACKDVEAIVNSPPNSIRQLICPKIYAQEAKNDYTNKI